MTDVQAVSRPATRVRGVLFDRDETIAYTDTGVYREVAVWAAREYGLDPRVVGQALQAQWAAQEDPAQVGGWWGLRSEADEAAYWERYAQELAARLDLPAERLGLLLQEWPYERYMKAYPAARGVLEALRARGVKVGVLSNTLPSIGVTLDAIGLGDVVDVAIASCSLGVHKPERDAYLRSADLMELPVQEILFVDDKPENVTAAREAGMRAALIDLRHGTPGALHDLRDVLELV
ncbi:HAD-IA family hydrolase [Deinococcus aquiradiocola]|uniref:HAD-IA family hydrolase n=1 Tax=Deinococcus aquiradiocola TaxID=393059 RepID=UPI00166D8369|nr:HAD-IA family hydrolase [Deinococcus aquiradiocola]